MNQPTPPTTWSPSDGVLERVEKIRQARHAVARIVFGQEGAVDQVLIALMAGGHVLVEGAPGLGKTLLVRTIATACGLKFSRIQFTPDLMPADITGATVLSHDEKGVARAQFERGPLFAQLVLADEINRTTPKTQSALLEAMQERTVTAGGRVHQLPQPFFVLATQNPIEMEGTYVLPEAQVDRFLLKVDVPFPSEDVLDTILKETTGSSNVTVERAIEPDDLLALQKLTREVPMSDPVRHTVVRLALASQPRVMRSANKLAQYIRFGITPRGAQALVLASKAHALLSGRFNVAFDDVRAMLGPSLRHRVQITYEGAAAGIDSDTVLTTLFDHVMTRARS